MIKSTRFLPAALMLLGVGVLAAKPAPVRTAPFKPLSTVPRTIEGQPSTDITIDSAEVKAAGTSDYLMRAYGDSLNPAFTLYIGYHDSQGENTAMHSPRNCLPGAGWEVLTKSTRKVGAHEINRFLLDYKGSRALVMYWYQGRGRVVANEILVKFNLFADAAATGRSDEALVRLVLPIASSDSTGSRGQRYTEQQADALGERAAERLIAELETILPARN